MASSADEQAQALADVERIAQEIYEAERRVTPGSWMPWKSMSPTVHEAYRGAVRDLLHRDVIRVGKRPETTVPLEGQLSIEEPCEHEWEVGNNLCVKGCGADYMAENNW